VLGSEVAGVTGDELPDDVKHRCAEECVCPIHGTPLIYWPHGNDHVCQDVDCRYGQRMAEQPIPGEFLPGGPGYEAFQQKILDDISAAYGLPEGLRVEWAQIRAEADEGVGRE
jgi:hypothetical protein